MPGQLAFVFPGQGSQHVGMLQELCNDEDGVVRDPFVEAADALGEDLWPLIAEGPEAELGRTENTQPALLAASVALWRVWGGEGGRQPDWLAGHSLGEYSALVAAKALAFDDAIRLVRARGQLMQEAVPAGEGLMAAILGLDDEVVERVCDAAAQGQVVQAANYNAPGQVVIAGSRAAVERAVEGAKAAGAKRALPLAVSAPSHCLLMRGAAERLKSLLVDLNIQPPQIPVVHNVDASVVSDSEGIRQRLVDQLFQPVQWTASVRRLAAEGVSHQIECGPGKVLTGLVKRIDKAIVASAINDRESIEAAKRATA